MAGAQELKLQIQTGTNRLRSHAPVPLELTLTWDGPRIIEGTLTLKVGDRLTIVNPDIAMVSGQQRFRVLLPPFDLDEPNLEIKASFSSTDWGPFTLGTFTVPIRAGWKRRALIGYVTPRGDAASRGNLPYLDQFNLARFQPGSEKKSAPADRQFACLDARVSANDLAAQAAELTAFDVLVLTADALSDLRRLQRAALLRWVDGGGRVFVDVSGAGHDSGDAEFLTELCDRETGVDGFFAVAGQIRSVEPLVMSRRGFGRAVVCLKSPNDLTDAETASVAGWLWKVRSGVETQVLASGEWEMRKSVKKKSISSMRPQFPAPSGMEDGYEFYTPSYAPKPLAAAKRLPASLLPSRIKTVPLPIIVTVLSLFLLVISPVDWLLLGKLKRRMLTWVLFPSMCVVFMFVMIVFANSYIGQGDSRVAIRFVDWGAGDRVSRVTTVETRFTSTSAPVRTELSGQLYADVDVSGASRWAGLEYGDEISFSVDIGSESSERSVTLTGQPPASYVAETELGKWTPVLFRQTDLSFGPEQNPRVDWADLTWKDIETDPDGAVGRLSSKNPTAAVIVLRGETEFASETQPERVSRFVRFIVDATAQSGGLLSVVSSIAPNGHPSLEDLAILDGGSDSEAVVLIITADGEDGDLMVQRRLFYGPTK